MTSYRKDYPRRELPDPYRRRREKYYPSSKPMDTVSQYRSSYVSHCAPPARSCRPPRTPLVTAPLSEATEHRDKYLGEVVEVCPAAQLLQRVPGCVLAADVEGPSRRGTERFRYSDRDESGHEWYTFDQCRMPGPENIVYDANRYVRGDSVKATRARAAASRAMNWKPLKPTSIPIAA